jgi:exonuclease VII large subunit
MQQAPAAATPTQATTVGTPAEVSIPSSRAELNGLVAKRSELERQLEQLTERRQELFQQRQRMGRQEGQGLDDRITLIDQQSTQIEREVMQLNGSIAQGTAQVAAQDGGAPFTFTEQDPNASQLRRDVRNAAEDAVMETMFGSAAGLLAIYVVWRGVIRRFIWKKKPVPVVTATVPDHSPRLEQLQQSVDVIALEVERISEAQRFLAKVINERALGAGEAQPLSVKTRDAASERR